jgi:hypothetical protein
MASDKERITTDSVLTFILLKKLMTPISKSKAFQLGLVDVSGRLIKKPSNEKEEAALTLFDKLIFKIKRLLRSKLTQLHSFLYLQTLGSEQGFYNKLVVKGSVESRAEIQRIKKDLDKVAENHNYSTNELLTILIHEDLQNKVDENGDLIV